MADQHTGSAGPLVNTLEVLTSLGFKSDPRWPSALTRDFGNLQLRASAVVALTSGRSVLLAAVFSRRREVVESQHLMPAQVESRALVLAHLVWALDPWLEEGRGLRGLLPWVQEQARWEARPLCQVEREWLRPAIARLLRLAADAVSGQKVSVHFDGEVLHFRAVGLACAVPASGKAWLGSVEILASDLRHINQRLQPTTSVDLWEGSMRFGRVRVPVIASPASQD